VDASFAYSRRPLFGFPPVAILCDVPSVKRHPRYADAKTGDASAAAELCADLVEPEAIRRWAEPFVPLSPILCSAHALESGGVNQIPEALAALIAGETGWSHQSSIVQGNIVSHTGADGIARLARQAEFVGRVEPGLSYILVDDFIGQGGTLANLRGKLLVEGAQVVAAIVLTGKAHSATLAPTPTAIHELRTKHGPDLEAWWIEHFGFSFDCLTASEARYLCKIETADAIRSRIVAALQEGNG